MAHASTAARPGALPGLGRPQLGQATGPRLIEEQKIYAMLLGGSPERVSGIVRVPAQRVAIAIERRGDDRNAAHAGSVMTSNRFAKMASIMNDVACSTKKMARLNPGHGALSLSPLSAGTQGVERTRPFALLIPRSACVPRHRA